MSIPERELVRRARAGDPPSFDALIRPHLKNLHRFILSTARNAEDAQDALQETLILAFRRLHSFRCESSFATWLYRIAINATRNWVRAQSRAARRDLVAHRDGTSPREPDPLQQVLRTEARQAVRSALLRLPDHYREPVLLRYYSELSYEEIADALGIALGTVKSRLAEARRLLAKDLSHCPQSKPQKPRSIQ